MTMLDSLAQRHVDEVRNVVAAAPLPELDTTRRTGGLPRPTWALVALIAVVLVFSLPFLLGSDQPDLDQPVVATTPPDSESLTEASTVDFGPEGGFIPTGSLSRSCAWCVGVLLADGRVLVIGGAWAEIYDPATWTFALLEESPARRIAESTDAVLLDDGRVLVSGISSGEDQTIIEIFDPSAGTFRTVEPPRSRYAGGARVIHASSRVVPLRLMDGRILILDQRGDRPEPMVFDPLTERFDTTGPPTLSNHIDASLLDDGRVLVFGFAGETELYDPVSDTFTPSGSMATPRYGFTVTRLIDGRVLVAGGAGEAGTVASAEVFDPATATFAPTGSMALERYAPAAALLIDGRVLVVGGGLGDDDETLHTAEIYDPETGRFTLAPPLTTARIASTAVTLADGTVLIFGHYGGNVGLSDARSASAEIFTVRSIQQPVGCCAPNPTALTITAEAGPDPGRVDIVVPPGGLTGAASIGYYWEYSVLDDDGLSESGVGQGGELAVPEECSQGCAIVVPDARGTVHVEIMYEGPPPEAASLIRFVVEPGD